MPTPKSVTKVTSRNGVKVEFTDSCDRTQYFMHELCRAALRDVGKYVRAEFANAIEQEFKSRKKKDGRKAVGVKIFSSKKTKFPRAQIYLKGRGASAVQTIYQEVGTSRKNRAGVIVPKKGLLTASVKNNVRTIMAIEGQYLRKLGEKAPEVPIPEDDVTDED